MSHRTTTTRTTTYKFDQDGRLLREEVVTVEEVRELPDGEQGAE